MSTKFLTEEQFTTLITNENFLTQFLVDVTSFNLPNVYKASFQDSRLRNIQNNKEMPVSKSTK